MKMKSTGASGMLPKVGLMAVVVLLMMIPLTMVRDLIEDRESTMRESIHDIESSWGEKQCLSGPKIRFTYDVQTTDEQGKPIVQKKEKDVFPTYLKYVADAGTQDLHRSIYDVTVYNSTVRLSGTFVIPEDMEKYTTADIFIGVSDLRGIEGEASINFNGREYEFSAADNSKAIQTTIQLPAAGYEPGAGLPFDMQFKLKGSESLQFRPVGNMTEAEMTSNCSTPSFVGSFLPTEREVNDNGFSAKWIVSQINRGAPESMEFGVRMLQPVTQYQQNTRSAKYGILIILLVFLAGFIVELLTRKNINILQYLVIGLSLVLFYSLLLSFSEIIGFGLSYLVAAAMTTLALTGYFRGILKSKVAYLLGGFVAIAYAISYMLLQMEHFALLGGTLVLFVCLVVVMYLTKDTGALVRPSSKEASDTE